jgi:methionine-rich copper-binding protein CopC
MLKKMVLTFAALGLLSASPAFAHAALKASAPNAGATVDAPQNLTLTFTEKVRLTAVRLVAGDKNVPVETNRSAPAAETFSLPLSSLTPGNYQVRWTALGADGHPVNGTFSFIVSQTAS